jgi:hypothetical protein
MATPADETTARCDAYKGCPGIQSAECEVSRNHTEPSGVAMNGAAAPPGVVDRRMRLSEAVQRCTVHWFNTALLEAQVRPQP